MTFGLRFAHVGFSSIHQTASHCLTPMGSLSRTINSPGVLGESCNRSTSQQIRFLNPLTDERKRTPESDMRTNRRVWLPNTMQRGDPLSGTGQPLFEAPYSKLSLQLAPTRRTEEAEKSGCKGAEVGLDQSETALLSSAGHHIIIPPSPPLAPSSLPPRRSRRDCRAA